MDKIVIDVLERIREECFNTEYCEYCKYSYKYRSGTVIHHECVLANIPENWKLETMEGLNDGC